MEQLELLDKGVGALNSNSLSLALEIFLVIALSFISAIIITQVYRRTFKGVAYSQSFVQTLIIMEVTIAIVMLVTGSNLARAFTLVGALSIVRFRISIKDPKDLAFVFFTMATGMAFGTEMYLAGGIFTIVMSALIYLLFTINYGEKYATSKILKIRVQEGIDLAKVEQILPKYIKNSYLVSRDNLGNELSEIVYIIEKRKSALETDLINELKKFDGIQKVTIVDGYQGVDI